MIDISQNGTQVRVSVDPGVCKGTELLLYWQCDNDIFSELLTQRLQERLGTRLENIRRDAYNQGWKDRASKKKKLTWFSCSF